MTIHNLKFQDVGCKKNCSDITGLQRHYFVLISDIYDDANMLKGVIVYTDKVTIVSSPVQEEIQITVLRRKKAGKD